MLENRPHGWVGFLVRVRNLTPAKQEEDRCFFLFTKRGASFFCFLSHGAAFCGQVLSWTHGDCRLGFLSLCETVKMYKSMSLALVLLAFTSAGALAQTGLSAGSTQGVQTPYVQTPAPSAPSVPTPGTGTPSFSAPGMQPPLPPQMPTTFAPPGAPAPLPAPAPAPSSSPVTVP